MENFIRAQFGDAESNCGKKGGITVKYRVDKQKSINNKFYCFENLTQQIIILILFIRIRIISVAVFRDARRVFCDSALHYFRAVLILHTFYHIIFSVFRVERALCDDSILYDCGCCGNICMGDSLLLQQVSLLPKFFFNILSGLLLNNFMGVMVIDSLCVFFPVRRKSKVRRSKSRYKMLEADDQDCLELQLPRAGKMDVFT